MTHAKAGPIFVVGAPRSGNTLVGCLLNKHPDCFILFERSIFSDTFRKWTRMTRLEQATPEDAFSTLILDGVQWQEYNRRARISKTVLQDCARRGEGRFADMFDAYMRLVIEKEKSGATVWGDKNPAHSGFLPSIQAEYPDARFINVFRDPRAVAASLTDKRFTPAGNDLLINAEVARHYIQIFDEGLARIDASSVLSVRYEDLVQFPEAELQRICDFLKLDYLDALLEPASEAVRQSIGWVDYKGWGKITPQPSKLPPQLAPLVEAHLVGDLRALGYAPLAPHPTLIQRVRLATKLMPFVAYRRFLQMFWKMRYGGTAAFVLHFYPNKEMYRSWFLSSNLASWLKAKWF